MTNDEWANGEWANGEWRETILLGNQKGANHIAKEWDTDTYGGYLRQIYADKNKRSVKIR